MLTYEDITDLFLKAATRTGLNTHPEYWQNSRSLEREFACTCHSGTCEEAEYHSACTVSFSWGPLDTALSIEGPVGVCDFFHEVDHDCPHLHTRGIPPLILDLSYSLALNGNPISEETLLSLTQTLRLRASEHSQRTSETRPGISMILQDNRLRPDTLTLQQRVELPIWHPDGMQGLLEDSSSYPKTKHREPQHTVTDDEDERELIADHPQPEKWLPQVLEEVCQDILQVLAALDTTIPSNTTGSI